MGRRKLLHNVSLNYFQLLSTQYHDFSYNFCDFWLIESYTYDDSFSFVTNFIIEKKRKKNWKSRIT